MCTQHSSQTTTTACCACHASRPALTGAYNSGELTHSATRSYSCTPGTALAAAASHHVLSVGCIPLIGGSFVQSVRVMSCTSVSVTPCTPCTLPLHRPPCMCSMCSVLHVCVCVYVCTCVCVYSVYESLHRLRPPLADIWEGHEASWGELAVLGLLGGAMYLHSLSLDGGYGPLASQLGLDRDWVSALHTHARAHRHIRQQLQHGK